MAPGEVQSILDGLRNVILFLGVLLVLSIGLNLYLAYLVVRFQDAVTRIMQGVSTMQESQAALREVAQYWLEQKRAASEEQEEDLHAPSRFAVSPSREEAP